MSDCNSCPSNNGCDKDKESCMIENNPLNNVKKVIGVMSGKGGVGKSTISTTGKIVADLLDGRVRRCEYFQIDDTENGEVKIYRQCMYRTSARRTL